MPRIGSLTRMLRDSLRELGLDQAIAEAAEAIPDARDRLDYVVQMTAQAAERALNSVEASQPHQDAMEKGAKALSKRWDEWFENPIELADARELVTDTRQYLGDVPGHTSFTNAQLLDIMMAQDFQDLTGQVIKRMMDVIQEIERQLLMVLLENIPEPAAVRNARTKACSMVHSLTPAKRAWWQARIRWTICWIALVSDCPFCLRSLTRPEAAQNKNSEKSPNKRAFPAIGFSLRWHDTRELMGCEQAQWQKRTTTKQKPPHPTDLKKPVRMGRSPDPES